MSSASGARTRGRPRSFRERDQVEGASRVVRLVRVSREAGGLRGRGDPALPIAKAPRRLQYGIKGAAVSAAPPEQVERQRDRRSDRHKNRSLEVGSECRPHIDDHAEALSDGLQSEVGIGVGMVSGSKPASRQSPVTVAEKPGESGPPAMISVSSRRSTKATLPRAAKG